MRITDILSDIGNHPGDRGVDDAAKDYERGERPYTEANAERAAALLIVIRMFQNAEVKAGIAEHHKADDDFSRLAGALERWLAESMEVLHPSAMGRESMGSRIRFVRRYIAENLEKISHVEADAIKMMREGPRNPNPTPDELRVIGQKWVEEFCNFDPAQEATESSVAWCLESVTKAYLAEAIFEQRGIPENVLRQRITEARKLRLHWAVENIGKLLPDESGAEYQRRAEIVKQSIKARIMEKPLGKILAMSGVPIPGL